MTKPRYSEQILPVPWPLVISRFHCNKPVLICFAEIILRLSNEEYISFVLFSQALEPSMNFNISKLVYLMVLPPTILQDLSGTSDFFPSSL